MVQKGSMLVFLALPLIVGGVVMLKLTGLTMWWALLVLGSILGTAGGIQLSLNFQSPKSAK
jgi:ABC-type transport system involved in multi-copper enzyme maturation permease subunit